MKNAGRTFRRLLFAALSFSFSARAATNAVPSTLYLNTQKIRGFDPATVNDVAANKSILRIYECLLQHSYLARPFTYEPLLAESLPGKTKPHILLTGGDVDALKGVFGPRAVVRPLLVAEGLRIIGARVFAPIP